MKLTSTLLPIFTLLTGCSGGFDNASFVIERVFDELRVTLVSQDGHCLLAEDARATLDGAPLELQTPGGTQTGWFLGFPNTSCINPTWSTHAYSTKERISRFEINTEGVAIRASFLDLFAERTATVVGGPEVQAGQPFTLEWSPATDVLLPVVGIGSSYAEIRIAGIPSSRIGISTDDTVVKEGIRLRTTVPAFPSAMGPGVLFVSATYATGVAECTGVAQCVASDQETFNVPVNWVP
ncbi:MAG: hypothetical protein ACKVPX_14330 [Myxococcaceae bacterium]